MGSHEIFTNVRWDALQVSVDTAFNPGTCFWHLHQPLIGMMVCDRAKTKV